MLFDPVFVCILSDIRSIDRISGEAGIDQGTLPGIGPFDAVGNAEAEIGGIPGGRSAVIHHVLAHDRIVDDIRGPHMISFVIGWNDTFSAACVIKSVGIGSKDVSPDLVTGIVPVGQHGPGTEVI